MSETVKMLLHAIVIAMVSYVLMVYVLKQPYWLAKSRSMYIGFFAFVYMMIFGHGMPSIAKLKAKFA